MRDFQQALDWHAAGIKVASSAHSVQHTQAILDELNEAIALLRKLKAAQTVGAYSQVTKEADGLLARHTGAPY